MIILSFRPLVISICFFGVTKKFVYFFSKCVKKLKKKKINVMGYNDCHVFDILYRKKKSIKMNIKTRVTIRRTTKYYCCCYFIKVIKCISFIDSFKKNVQN